MKAICPNCGQHYDVDQEYAGCAIDCQTCGSQFMVDKTTDTHLPVEGDVKHQEATVLTTSSAQPAMRPLICEMCGSSDMIKTNGVFVCQSCGTKYSAEEAKKMMIAGTVNVTGTVKVDNSDKLANLYKLARRSRDTKDCANVIKYYELILQENADSWEAAFYTVYYRVLDCSIAEIQDAAKSLGNTIGSVASLVGKSIMDDATRQKVYQEISSHIVEIGTILHKASLNHYGSASEQYVNDAQAVANMSIVVGNALFRIYEQAPKSINTASFLDPWKLSVDIRGKCGVDLAERQEDIKTIKKFDPEYTKRRITIYGYREWFIGKKDPVRVLKSDGRTLICKVPPGGMVMITAEVEEVLLFEFDLNWGFYTELQVAVDDFNSIILSYDRKSGQFQAIKTNNAESVLCLSEQKNARAKVLAVIGAILVILLVIFGTIFVLPNLKFSIWVWIGLILSSSKLFFTGMKWRRRKE